MPQPTESAGYVFVYGTLRKGGSNDVRRFSPAAMFVAQARIRGRLFDLGSYPGARLGGEAWIVGEVYAIEPELERQLDVLEEVDGDDGEYVKRSVPVVVCGNVVHCLVYEINASRVQGRRVIVDGDWLGVSQP